MTERRSLTDQALFLLGGRITSFALTFALPMILARMFSKYEFGLYRKFSVFFVVVFILAQFGLTYSLPSLLPRFPEKTKSILANTVFLQGLICVLLIVAGGVLSVYGVGWGIPVDFVKVVFPLGAFAGFMVASSSFDQMLVIESRGQAAGVLMVVYDTTKGLFLIGAALLYHDVIMVLWGITLAAFLRFLAMVLYYRKRYQLSLSQVSGSTFRDQWKLAGPMSVQAGGHLLEIHTDKYLIIFFYSSATYAVYSVGAFQIPVVAMLFHSITAVILPRLAEYYGENNMESLVGLWNEAIRKSAILLFPLFAMLYTVHYEFIITLFSAKYEQSVPIFAVYLWIVPTYIMANNLLLQAIGHSKYLFWTGIYKPMLAVLMVWTGLHYFGLVGAAGGLVLYHYLATLLYAWLSARALKVPFLALIPYKELGQISFYMLIAGVTTWVATSWIQLPVFWMLVVKCSVFLAVAAPMMLLSSILTKEDREKAKSLLFRVLRKAKLMKPPQEGAGS
ncbi:MAG: lipopolysaccharide biosynthesis protein [Deltaproteobacteria bacterium]|nr:MAG: lipopolysaccharide biosynthesis protein [Deltaproteobacteria bacterium]